MSYEGYSQFWCHMGHYWTEDCYNVFYGEDVNICPTCGELPCYHHMVDTTNDSGDFIPVKVLKRKRCDKCNSCIEIVYKIPPYEEESNE